MKSKKEIRGEIKKIFTEKLSENVINTESKKVCSKIISSNCFKSAEVVFAYMALKDELNLDSVINAAFESGKKVAVPVCIKETGDLVFRFINRESKLKNGSYGILEPELTDEEAFTSLENSYVLILVPGRAFTKDGLRLGRGKGYYDKYLERILKIAEDKKNRVHLAGVCLSEQLQKELPSDEHDIKMDEVFY